jgi:hypothetical protein
MMSENNKVNGSDDRLVVEVIGSQLQHFQQIDPPCRGLQLPDGVLLRHTQSQSLYFYLRTTVADGKIKTLVFSSDSPYDRQKASIGSVLTPMFETGADYVHLEKLERLIREWVDFVQEQPESNGEFQSFEMNP